MHIPRWKWTAEHPVPPWTTISKALMWSSDEHRTLRETLGQPKVKRVVKSTAAECLTATLGETNPGEALCEVRMGPAVGATPDAIAGLKPRIVIYQIPKGTAAGRPLCPMMLPFVLDMDLMPIVILVGGRPDVRVVLNAISSQTDDEFYTRDIALYNKGVLTSNYTMATTQLVVLTLRHIKEWKVRSIEISIALHCILLPIEISIVFLTASEVHYLEDDRYNNPAEDDNRLPPEILGCIMHQLKLDVIEESVNEIWVAVPITSPILLSNIRLRLRSHVNCAVLLGLATAPSKEQLKKFANDGMFKVLPLSPNTAGY